MKTLLPALLLTTLLASCAKDDGPSLLGEWRPLSAYAVYESSQTGPPDTIRLDIDPRVRLQFLPRAVRHPFFLHANDTIRYTDSYTREGATLYLGNDRAHPGTLLELSDTRLRVKLPVETANPNSIRYHVITASR